MGDAYDRLRQSSVDASNKANELIENHGLVNKENGRELTWTDGTRVYRILSGPCDALSLTVRTPRGPQQLAKIDWNAGNHVELTVTVNGAQVLTTEGCEFADQGKRESLDTTVCYDVSDMLQRWLLALNAYNPAQWDMPPERTARRGDELLVREI